jgi:hypothetical protein
MPLSLLHSCVLYRRGTGDASCTNGVSMTFGPFKIESNFRRVGYMNRLPRRRLLSLSALRVPLCTLYHLERPGGLPPILYLLMGRGLHA